MKKGNITLKILAYILLNTIFCKQIIAYLHKRKTFSFKEKFKMLNGEKYNAGIDIYLFAERQKCKKLCKEYNNLPPEKIGYRNNILTKLLGKVGKCFLIEQPFICDYGYNIEIGEEFCANHNLIIIDPAKVIFGNNVMIGPNCSFYTAKHPTKPEERIQGIEWAEPIKIGNNVWLGGNVTVLAGVSIGDNSVIGAGSVVNKSIPANVVAIGNPCKIIKTIK